MNQFKSLDEQNQKAAAKVLVKQIFDLDLDDYCIRISFFAELSNELFLEIEPTLKELIDPETHPSRASRHQPWITKRDRISRTHARPKQEREGNTVVEPVTTSN